mmetsp:Transcript_22401/g.76747  ORF Transcript_22401/g.76747 Transcript_22401/m.76747 type:complete len:425 (+) Transcript_22401:1472-2746(+)
MLHVVVDPPEAVGRVPGAPHQAVEESRHQCLGLLDQDCDDVLVRVEQGVDAVVVPLSVRADGQEVGDDGLGGLQVADRDGPVEGGDLLGTDLNGQDPLASPVARGTTQSLFDQLARVRVDSLHDNGRPFQDGAHEDLGDQSQSPAESFLGMTVVRRFLEHLNRGRHKVGNVLRRDAIADVAKAKLRDLFDDLPRILQDLQGHVNDLGHDVVQPRVGLLEVVLPCWAELEEALVDVAANVVTRGLVEGTQGALQLGLPGRRGGQVLLQHLRHVVPHPGPSHLVVRVPNFGQQRPHRRQHARPELGELDLSFAALDALGDTERQGFALLLQAIRIRYVGHDVLPRLQDFSVPRETAQPGHAGIHLEHLLERLGQHLALHHVPGNLLVDALVASGAPGAGRAVPDWATILAARPARRLLDLVRRVSL